MAVPAAMSDSRDGHVGVLVPATARLDKCGGVGENGELQEGAASLDLVDSMHSRGTRS